MEIETELAAALPEGVVVPAAQIEQRYFGDWIHRAPDARPVALALPRSTAHVATILRLCHARRVSVVAQGGRTGLAGGAVPSTGCVILSTERMRSIGPPDPASATIVAEAGAVLEAVQRAADAENLFFPLDIGGRGTCTIGGNISTNAGGNRVLRYGMMRDLVLGLEAVLADGTVLTSMNAMQKNNTGYDLKQLFIGTEGTLGIVTRAVLRLFPRPSTRQTALCAVADYGHVLQLLVTAKRRLGADLAAFEVMWPEFYRLATDVAGLRAPLARGQGVYVLVESLGSDPVRDDSRFQEFVESTLADGSITDAVVAQSSRDCEDIWRIRDSSAEFPRTFWPYVGFDVSIPVGAIGRFIDECTGRLAARWPTVQTVWFGHVADSNIHIGVRGPDPLPESEVDVIVYDCVGEYAGSISAEHGIGTLKRAFLDKSRTAEELAAMRLIKRALDPADILNPGKILMQLTSARTASTCSEYSFQAGMIGITVRR